MMTPQHFVVLNDRAYDAVKSQDGHWYALDPDYELQPSGGARRMALPISTPLVNTLGALTQTQQEGIGAVETGVSFIPVYGPIIAAGIALVAMAFSGGDPTPIGTLWKALIQLRTQKAELTNILVHYGKLPATAADTFDATGVNPTDANTGGVLSAVITADELDMFTADISNTQKLRSEVKRGMEYDAIKKLQGDVQSLSQAAQQAQIEAEIAAGIAAGVATAGGGTGANYVGSGYDSQGNYVGSGGMYDSTGFYTGSGGGYGYGPTYPQNNYYPPAGTPPPTTNTPPVVTDAGVTASTPAANGTAPEATNYVPYMIGGALLLVILMQQKGR